MKTIKIADEQSVLIVYALRLYAIECDLQAAKLRNKNNKNEMIAISSERAEQARELSTLISRA